MAVQEGPAPAPRAGARGWVSTEAGAHLRNRRSRDTRPEVELRRHVHALGLRFRLRRKVVPRCTPDFVLVGRKLAVFVDGCYWHGCPEHGPTEFRGPNAVLWREKIRTNQERDRRQDREITEAGWRVIRVWECEVRRAPAAAADRVLRAAER